MDASAGTVSSKSRLRIEANVRASFMRSPGIGVVLDCGGIGLRTFGWVDVGSLETDFPICEIGMEGYRIAAARPGQRELKGWGMSGSLDVSRHRI